MCSNSKTMHTLTSVISATAEVRRSAQRVAPLSEV